MRVARPAKPKGRCRVCESPEEPIIVRVLAAGVSPRSIAQRFGSVSRKDIIHHARVCVAAKAKTEEEEHNAEDQRA